MRATKQLGVFMALVAVAPVLTAQKTASLSKPDAETTESFTQVTAIRELPSGKLLVADSRDKVVHLVDLAAGAMTKVGREGNGPGEYALPMALIGGALAAHLSDGIVSLGSMVGFLMATLWCMTCSTAASSSWVRMENQVHSWSCRGRPRRLGAVDRSCWAGSSRCAATMIAAGCISPALRSPQAAVRRIRSLCCAGTGSSRHSTRWDI